MYAAASAVLIKRKRRSSRTAVICSARRISSAPDRRYGGLTPIDAARRPVCERVRARRVRHARAVGLTAGVWKGGQLTGRRLWETRRHWWVHRRFDRLFTEIGRSVSCPTAGFTANARRREVDENGRLLEAPRLRNDGTPQHRTDAERPYASRRTPGDNWPGIGRLPVECYSEDAVDDASMTPAAEKRPASVFFFFFRFCHRQFAVGFRRNVSVTG